MAQTFDKFMHNRTISMRINISCNDCILRKIEQKPIEIKSWQSMHTTNKFRQTYIKYVSHRPSWLPLSNEHGKWMSRRSNCSSLKAIFHNMHRKLASKLNEIRFFFPLVFVRVVRAVVVTVVGMNGKRMCALFCLLLLCQIATKADSQSALFVCGCPLVYFFLLYIYINCRKGGQNCRSKPESIY